MYILGISGGLRPGYQDVSACLIKDGHVIAAVEEERINRIKFSAGRLPILSIKEVLRIASIDIEQVDAVAFHGCTWGNEIVEKLNKHFIYHFGYSPPIERYHHHLCHAAGSFFSSGFESALIITMDNSGDGISLQVAKGHENNISVIKQFSRPNSLGMFYSTITEYCGFTKDSDEYKLMALAALGNKTSLNFNDFINFCNGELTLNTDFIHTPLPGQGGLHRDEMNFNDYFLTKMGKSRGKGNTNDLFYCDVAFAAQTRLEQVVMELVEYYISETGETNLCTSGGVALNCAMNRHLANHPQITNFFVQPASSDAGIAQGAAYLSCLKRNITPTIPSNVYWGPSFSNDEIREVLNNCKVSYKKIDNKTELAADMLAGQRIIGWFQSAMEFGPRALGNRSILAAADAPDIKSRVNHSIKFRDSFRPFGAALLREDFSFYFDGLEQDSPYMTTNFLLKPSLRKKFDGICHNDGTTRIQTVSKLDNPVFYELLLNLKKKTGNGICLNTSFNLNYEPIVCTPQHALATFFASGLDALFIGDFVIEK